MAYGSARGQGVVGSNHGMGGEDHRTVDATAAVSVRSCTPMLDRGVVASYRTLLSKCDGYVPYVIHLFLPAFTRPRN